jgi:dihydropteroate synthase
VARAALRAGAHLINDIWGFRGDRMVAEVVAEFAAPAIIMHNQREREFHDVIGDIRAGLEASLAIADEVGVPRERLIIDPGFGFGWTPEQNVDMLRRLGELRDMGLPMLLATSRKSTIGAMLDGAPPEGRLLGTAASMALAVPAGVDIVRVHDIAAMRDVLQVADAIVRGWKEP